MANWSPDEALPALVREFEAFKAGGKVVRPVENQFYGDRTGQFEDPFGHRWSVATHVEDVSPEEMAKRATALGG